MRLLPGSRDIYYRIRWSTPLRGFDTPATFCDPCGIGPQLVQVTWAHTMKLRELPLLHRDPFDRMLVAQAMVEPLRLLTHDAALSAYSELVLLA